MRYLDIVNLALVGLIVLTAAFFVCADNSSIPLAFIQRPEQKELPRSPFAETEEFFQEIGESVFALKWVPPQMQLPDLRAELLFFGKNARPDALTQKPSFHLGIKGSTEQILACEAERVYLVYQGNYSSDFNKNHMESDTQSSSLSHRSVWEEATWPILEGHPKNGYAFSPGNQATPLWFEVKGIAEHVLEICVGMLDEKGLVVSRPQEFHRFHCQAQELSKASSLPWDLGGYRVDATLLVRQRARWVGSDLFLALHGGDEFKDVVGKERIDFLESEHPYSCFVSVGDFLVWKENRWITTQKFEESHHLPLMVVKKIDDKMIFLELWDPQGKNKTLLHLIRSREHCGKPNVSQEIKFVGAKTWAQFIVECRNGVRMTLRPHDWLVLTQEGWKKLDSPDQIDAYVNQTLTGPLFILDKVVKQNGKQALIGHLFNASRTEVEQVELTSSSGTSLANFCRHLPMAPPPLPLSPPEIYSEGIQE